MHLPIPDRETAGQWLAEVLQAEQFAENAVVLALPRGGVPVAYEIANALNSPLDLLLVRKLGTPAFPELAMGAIASGNVKILNRQVIQSYHISNMDLNRVEATERAELLRREQAYRGDRALLDLSGRDVIIVDDGLATGATMLAAIEAVKQQNIKSITVTVPVAPADTLNDLSQKVDRVICPFQPDNFAAIGQWYERFPQVSDDEVKSLLQQAWRD